LRKRHAVENIERLDRFNAQFVELVVHEAQHECRIDIDVRAPHVTAYSRSFGASLQLSSASAAASMRPETARPTPLDPTLTGSKIRVYRARKTARAAHRGIKGRHFDAEIIVLCVR